MKAKPATKRSKAAVIRRKQKQVDVKVAREWFRQMIDEVRAREPVYAHLALDQLEIRVREWRP